MSAGAGTEFGRGAGGIERIRPRRALLVVSGRFARPAAGDPLHGLERYGASRHRDDPWGAARGARVEVRPGLRFGIAIVQSVAGSPVQPSLLLA